MICYSLFSGSSGNSIFIREGDSAVLVDAGGSLRRVEKALLSIGEDLSRVKGVLVTHEHSDHVSALGQIALKRPIPIYCLKESAKEIYLCTLMKGRDEEAAALAKCIRTIEPGNLYGVGELDFEAFSTPHDSAASCGYLFGEKTLGVATDLGRVTPEVRRALTGCRSVILESNHDTDLLFNGPYPPYLKERVASDRGHLNNADCAAFAAELVSAGCRDLMLFHLSKENNTPEDALRAALEAVRPLDASVRLIAADRSEVTRFL